ncbi:receptor kinase-like protein Xa21 [Corylus avellana]|uniref:receptor kinase-like protein Xa21 n=1 Tax=Corylus avellana TaxID=13451 RepID=UPI00286BA77C|nr:receptor kinase-like protein Xa21 [Corylus avellana]
MEISASLIYFMLYLLVMLHCYLAAAVRTNITTDQSALLVLKAHITDDPKKILATNWSSAAGSACNWVGITCDTNHHRVTALNLSYMGLNGTIPPHLGNLSFLTHLSFRANRFHGSLPAELASLRGLQVISFGENNLDGEIPSWLGLLPKLEELYLCCNSFRGTIPPSLFNTSSELRIINLGHNMLTGWIPPSLSNCTSLKEINLFENNLTGEVPSDIGNLPNLVKLDINNNSLTGVIPYSIFNHSTIRVISLYLNFLSGHLPSGIGNWVPNLEVLYLWGNEIDGIIPSSISNASKLIKLELEENYFSGSIPHTLANLRHLEVLNLAGNLLTRESATLELSFLSSLTNCRKLTRLMLADNQQLNGTLPISIGNFSGSLQYFSAFGCNIKGTIPKQIGNLSNLLVLALQNNELGGAIPSTVRGMRNLQGLCLQGNRLQGSIPDVICDLSNLGELFLSGNELYGSLPTCWKSLTSLRKLFLDANHLTSKIPPSLWSLGDLMQVNLSLNSLSGPLPSDIGNLKVVTLLDLSWNQLSGQIPAAIGGLQNLERLSLAHNKFQGHIPQSFGQSISMQVLDLSHNNLSGVIPESLEKLHCLKHLDVSFNRLGGEIPSGMDIAIFSAQSFMGNEGLCGPPQFKVPPCQVVGQSKAHTSVKLAYILPAVIAAILVLILILFLIITLKRNAKSASQEAPTLATWRRISYLELERATDRFSESNLVGKGSFGSVYRGTLSDGMSVAVKVFNLDIQGSFKSFDAECKVLRRIRHRNLVKIISCCSNNDFKALVLEYMPNGSLNKWLYSHTYSLDILHRMNIMIDVASSLEYLHHGSHVPVVHCDLKPSNILLNDDMIAHVGDFGISKLLGDGDSMTQTMTLATIGYIAPEYGSQGIISTSGDVYSYGILLMETFTGKKPTDEMFSGEMSLKRWVKESLPHAVIKVVDGNLLQKNDRRFDAKQDCIFSIMRLAMDCSAEAPEQRMQMRDVVKTLKNIKMKFVDGD